MAQEKKIRDEQCRLNNIKRKKIHDFEEAAARHEVDICKRELIRQEEERLQRIRNQRARNEENMKAVKSQFGKREKEVRGGGRRELAARS